MDKEKLKLLQNAILILVFAVLGALYFTITQIVPKATTIKEISQQYVAESASLTEKERKYDEMKASLMEATNVDLTGSKDMYKPIEDGLDAESIVAGQFNEILGLLRANAVKARSVNYEYNPASDEFVKGAGAKVSACHATLELIATYKNFENFLKDLYMHEHFLDIAKVEILPYEKDKTVLLINCKLKLYAKKS